MFHPLDWKNRTSQAGLQLSGAFTTAESIYGHGHLGEQLDGVRKTWKCTY